MSVQQVEECNIEHLAGGMEKLAPDVWRLLGELLQADQTLAQQRERDQKRRAKKALEQRRH